MSDAWNAEQVYEEIRRSRDEREAESERLRELGPDPEQLAGYRADLRRTTVSFRRRVGIVGTAVMATMVGSFLLFGRKLDGTPELVYAWTLVVVLAAWFGWMTWHLVRNLTAAAWGYRAVKARAYVPSTGPAQGPPATGQEGAPTP